MTALKGKSDRQVETFHHKLSVDEIAVLVNSMRTIQNLLSANYNNRLPTNHLVYHEGLKPGDVGYLIYLHGVLYAREPG